MASSGRLIRDARTNAGLTQAELARRLGSTQSAIARLEAPRSNPTVATLGRALAAVGHRLEMTAVAAPSEVDETLIARQLRLTPAQRVAAFQAAYRNMRALLAQARSAGG